MNRNAGAPAWGGATSAGGIPVPTPFEHVTELGPAQQVCPGKENVLLAPLGFAIAGALLVVLGIAIALWGPLPLGLLPLCLGAFLSALGGWNVWFLRGGVSSAVVYQSGFAALVGSRVTVWPWPDVTSILSKDTISASGRGRAYSAYTCEVSRKDGETLVLDSYHFEEVGSLIRSIKEHVAPLLLAPLKAAYDAGQPLTFGAVSVSRDGGIGEAGKQVAWASILNVTVKRGRLVIAKKDGGSVKVRVSKIPNVEQLGSLIGVSPSSMELGYF